ncbi:MAG: DUF975 family protein [Lachnospiraceae bacterium]|nr:DUF975 family protein [Lachnospiraceae bacterium]
MNRKNSELKNMARAFLLGNYKVTIAALCVTGAITMAISMIFEYVAGENSSVFLAVNILLAILDYVLNAGLMTVHLDIARRRRSNWQRVFEPFRNANRFLGLSAVLFVVTAIPFLPALITESMKLVVMGQSLSGSAHFLSEDAMSDANGMVMFLLVIGGIAAIYITLSFFPAFYLLIDNPNLSVTGCIARSFSLMKGNRIRLLLMDLSFAGWCLLGILSFGIGFLWIVPYYLQSTTNFYLDLIREFDIQVNFSAEGLAEAGKFQNYLRDTVVVAVGSDAEKPQDYTKEAMPGEEPVAEQAVPDTVTEKTEIEKEKETELPVSGESDMDVLDDSFFDE